MVIKEKFSVELQDKDADEIEPIQQAVDHISERDSTQLNSIHFPLLFFKLFLYFAYTYKEKINYFLFVYEKEGTTILYISIKF
ncbi:hypothetical protein BDC45DRAFT_275881 [Circinella umbellata]|nr:hypothetical protein BDC45DRAFT_275881 [Circinella umbellata]